MNYIVSFMIGFIHGFLRHERQIRQANSFTFKDPKQIALDAIERAKKSSLGQIK